jgi:hypothetical protein
MIGDHFTNGDAAMSAIANKKLMEEIFAGAGNPDPRPAIARCSSPVWPMTRDGWSPGSIRGHARSPASKQF